MNEVIYSYFMQNYGTVNNAIRSSLMCSYKAKSIRELKKELKVLKARKADTVEIKFVANILRKKLQKTDLTCLDSGYHSNTVHHDQFIGKIPPPPILGTSLPYSSYGQPGNLLRRDFALFNECSLI